MRAVTTAGESVLVDCAVGWVSELLADATAGELTEAGPAGGTAEAGADGETVRLEIEADRRPFDRDGWTLIGRGAWAATPRTLIEDACSSGFDLQVEPRGSVLHVAARYRPAPRTRAANVLLRARFRLLAAQTLLHYPALWWASVRGRVPLHVSVTAGAGGVGKSTLLSAGLKRGERATADNLCACDARRAYGVVEPLRVAGGTGRAAATHGRREYPLPGRVPSLEPDRLVVLRRGAGSKPSAGPLPSAEAARELVAGTYMAGELRRFWSFAATLALATGIGPAHPDVCGTATLLASRLPCFEVRVAHGAPAPIGELVSLAGAR